MKKFVCFILLISSINCSAQYSRSYGNVLPTSHGRFSNYFHVDEGQKTLFTNLYVDDYTNELTLTTQEIDEEGEVIGVRKDVYKDSKFINKKDFVNSISGIFYKDGIRFYTLLLESTNTIYLNRVNIVWLKTDEETGELLDMKVSDQIFHQGYTETKLINGEMVTYLTSGLYLKRISMDLDQFGNEISENITTHNDLAAEIEKGRVLGTLLVVKGKEIYVNNENANDWHLLLVRRNGVNDSEKLQVSPNYHFLNLLSATTFLNDEDQIVITDGEHFNIIDENGTVLKTHDTEMGLTLHMNQNYTFFKNGKYHVLFQVNGNYGATLLILDKEFNKLVQKPMDEINMVRTTIVGDKCFIEGTIPIIQKFTKDPNSEIPGDLPYLECFKEEPVLFWDEYFRSFSFNNSDLTVNAGIGTRVFLSAGIFRGIKYKDKSINEQLLENYLAKDTDNTLFGNTNFFFEGTSEVPGPCTNYADYDEVEEAKYNRSYFVSKKMIENHLDSLANGSNSYIPPWAIRNWPGNGNPEIGQAQKLAEFYDKNGNGIYEPMQGDYPLIYGDECIFSITHYWDLDMTNRFVEFHSYLYHFSCDTSSILNNVLFRKLNVISRGADLDEFYMGIYQDGDVGHPKDDYVGTNVDLGMTYIYNARDIDAYLVSDDMSGYQLMAQGTMVLKGFKQKDDGIDNDFGVEENESINGVGYGDEIVDNEYRGLDYSIHYYDLNVTYTNNDWTTPVVLLSTPENQIGWYNNLRGLTAAGNPITYGDYGFGGTLNTKYAFPWLQDTYNFGTNGETPPFEGWAEFNTDGNGQENGINLGDRRILAGLGQTELRLNDTISIDYTYLFARDKEPTSSRLTSVDSLFRLGEYVRNSFLENELSCGSTFDFLVVPEPDKKEVEPKELQIFPNPSTGELKILGISEQNEVNIYALNGAVVRRIQNYQEGELIDLYELRSAIYLIQIIDENVSIVKKLVKI